VTLHDLTGFEARCDALLFTMELNVPPDVYGVKRCDGKVGHPNPAISETV
jgi:hypothetical protein